MTVALTPEFQVGARMRDGSIYAGISPDTGRALFTTPTDVPHQCCMAYAYYFDENAQIYAGRLEAHGHEDWRVPSARELNVLFNNRMAINGFYQRWYWSSTPSDCHGHQYIQHFQTGGWSGLLNRNYAALRCVRG